MPARTEAARCDGTTCALRHAVIRRLKVHVPCGARRTIIRTAGLLFLAAGGAMAGDVSHSDRSLGSCQVPVSRALDFWIGDWDAFETGGSAPVARIRIDRILGGCALHEMYEDRSGVQGQSLTVYDAGRGIWHQTWVTSRGALLVLEGRFQEGVLAMEGHDLDAEGKPRVDRAEWRAMAGGVRESAVRSTDGGKSWSPWYDLTLRSHRSTF